MSKTYMKVGDKYDNMRNEVALSESVHANFEARFAMVLMEKWGMVNAEPDGEDSAGRARLRPATPKEVVNRACELSSLAMDEFRARDWIVDLPNPFEDPEAAPAA